MPPLLNAVTIELLLQFSTPVAVMLLARVMKVTLPVVFTFKLVKVLLLMFVVLLLALEWEIYVCALLPTTECTIPWKLLLLMLIAAVVGPELVIPVTAPEVAALKVIAPPVLFPIWLPLMFRVVATAPEFVDAGEPTGGGGGGIVPDDVVIDVQNAGDRGVSDAEQDARRSRPRDGAVR